MNIQELKNLLIKKLKNNFSEENIKNTFVQGYVFSLHLNAKELINFRKKDSKKIFPTLVNARLVISNKYWKVTNENLFVEFVVLNKKGRETKKTYSMKYEKNPFYFSENKSEILKLYKIEMKAVIDILYKEKDKIDVICKELFKHSFESEIN